MSAAGRTPHPALRATFSPWEKGHAMRRHSESFSHGEKVAARPDEGMHATTLHNAINLAAPATGAHP